ncbi:MAG: hypothetical protein RIS64_4446, partial [Bacteroidota bacterium]
MSVNKNALIRYKTIDACLQNRYRKWTLENLVEKCSEALYEYEGIQKGVSLRTVQMDIQMMRSEKLGYNAPIIVLDKKFYTYEDAKYSITKIPLTHQDLNILSEVVKILQQFKGFNHFQAVESMVGRLQHQIHSVKNKQSNVIHFETNEHLLRGYQEKYLYILVDEYQDTSGTQNKLVQQLINYWEKPNVFVVGDDDQSIYRFQGANVENMLAFAEQYQQDLMTVVLTNNYRSTQPILNISKTLIDKNEERLVKQLPGLSKDLLAANARF